MDPMMASIMMFGGNFAPRQWAFCQGQLLSISSQTAMFSLLGTIYGGDGRTTFALPDMRGRSPMGTGNGPGLTLRRLGQKGGQEDVTLTEPQMPSHSHSVQTSVKASSASAGKHAPGAGDFLAAANVPQQVGSQNANAYIAAGNAGATENLGGVQTSIGNAGGSQPHNNMQPFLVVPFIIAMQGIFPSRN
jgi:microcystin-dependent protein